MAKRFIDTDLFDDAWFMELSMEAKILWVYMITKCDHAGILELNKKLCEFQTGIKSYATVSKELIKGIVTVKDGVIFLPKFITFQYPNFPNSNVKQQASAIKILEKYGLFKDGVLTVNKDLTNTSSSIMVMDMDNGNEDGNGNGNEKAKKKLIYPFDTPRFMKMWGLWLDYRKEIRKPIKGIIGQQSALKKLSKYDEATACAMIEEAMANGWQGLHELKTTNNGRKTKQQQRNDLEEIYRKAAD